MSSPVIGDLIIWISKWNSLSNMRFITGGFWSSRVSSPF